MSSMTVQPPQPRRATSLFWPVVLIGIGVILLLDDRGLIVQSPLALIAQFWPVLLIVAGVEMLFSRTGVLATLVSFVLGVAVVAGALVILTTPGPPLAWPMWFTWSASPQGPDIRPVWRTDRIAQPLQDARNATITFDLPVGRGGIAAARDTANVIEGDVTYYGALVNDIARDRDEVIARVGGRQPRNPAVGFDEANVRWDFRLNTSPAYDLDINIGTGSYEFDLSEFRLRGLSLDMASGSQTVKLPASGDYRIKLNMASGSTDIRVPAGVPVRVNYQMLSGSLSVLDAGRVSGVGKSGTIEAGRQAAGGPYLTIDLDMASGAVTIR